MITTNKNCETCVKSDVCKIKEKYEAFLEDFKKVNTNEIDISIHINCNSYYGFPIYNSPYSPTWRNTTGTPLIKRMDFSNANSVCSQCGGAGTIRHCDAAGDMEDISCPSCRK